MTQTAAMTTTATTIKNLSTSRLILVTAIGGCLEFFDFTIFALFSLYISQAFFPFNHKVVGLINTFAVFAVGYFARPLGGLLISHFGDRRGRKFSLLLSVNLMALSTFLIAILPTYQHIGMMAPILLVALRLLQGAAVGGELPGVITYLTEYFHMRQPAAAMAFVLAGVTFGNVLASALGAILSSLLSPEAMQSFGWRIPFLVGATLGLIGYVLRRQTQETIIFVRLVSEHALHRIPLLKVLRNHPKEILIGVGMTALTSATVFVFLYFPVYLTNFLHRPEQEAYSLTTACFSTLGVLTAVFGALSTRIASVRLCFSGLILSLLLCLSAPFWVFRSNEGIFYFGVLLACSAALINANYTYLISTLFPPSVRYSGVATAYNIGIACFGALAPVAFLVALFRAFHSLNLPFYFLFGCGVITLGCLYGYLTHLKTLVFE